MDSPSPTSPRADQPKEEKNGQALFFDSEVSQWRLLLTVIVAGLFMSFSFNIFILKENRILMLQVKQQNEQLVRINQLTESMQKLIQDVVEFATKHPDIQDILSKHGINVMLVPASGIIPPSPLTAPAPPSK